MSETSGGAYQRQTISFNQVPDMQKIDTVFLYDTATAGRALKHSVDDDGKLHPEHLCEQPEALTFDGDEWTCPECGTVYEVRTDAWWEPRDGD